MDDVIAAIGIFYAAQLVFWFGWLAMGALVQTFATSAGDAR